MEYCQADVFRQSWESGRRKMEFEEMQEKLIEGRAGTMGREITVIMMFSTYFVIW